MTAERHHRRSIRLQGYDYSSAGAYFVTICANARAYGHTPLLFGKIVGGEMRLNEAGRIVEEEWRLSATLRTEIELDECVVMPNHVHGIVIINEHRDHPPQYENAAVPSVGAYGHTPLRSPSKTIGAMIRGFKSSATKRINQLRGTPGIPVWQRNYYEHVIRNEDSLDRIRLYIAENPARWAYDRENPEAASVESEEKWEVA
jgi:putative transposase